MSHYFRMAIAVTYIILGIIFFSTDAGKIIFGKNVYGLMLGGLFIIYGGFRFYRAQRKWDKNSWEK